MDLLEDDDQELVEEGMDDDDAFLKKNVKKNKPAEDIVKQFDNIVNEFIENVQNTMKLEKAIKDKAKPFAGKFAANKRERYTIVRKIIKIYYPLYRKYYMAKRELWYATK